MVDGLVAQGFSARSACRTVALNRSTYIKHLRGELSIRAIRRRIVADYDVMIHGQSGGTYGWRRIRAELLDEYEMIVNRKLIKAVMREQRIAGVPRIKIFRNPLADKRVDADLVKRLFTTDGPNRLWLTDVTEHPTREGKVYCCVVLDCFARTAVGRSFSTINDTALVSRAVSQAHHSRERDGATVMHSDHGANFTSWGFSENLRQWELTASLGSVGDCFDNAAMETFWGRMQTELLDRKRTWQTVIELVTAMNGWLDFYNGKRRHSYTGYMSPDAYEVLWNDISNPLPFT
ncbi:IS3 family transposase [Arthrobacter oryzae]|uniref:IS3 family transposase n=1 Tax=Arthrobacter oryzae TaxID=409290 RepID=A0A3N0BLI1_9MICC|nr:IS3 family transposase [Arthrobacter oryzae]RNL49460.1 IS3 family transposase [Arthrobacter oryzae]